MIDGTDLLRKLRYGNFSHVIESLISIHLLVLKKQANFQNHVIGDSAENSHSQIPKSERECFSDIPVLRASEDDVKQA